MTPPPIVFDLDGTLVDSAPDLAGAMNAVLAEEGLPQVPVAQVRDMVGEGALKMLERGFAYAGKVLEADRRELLRQRFLTHYGAMLTERTRPFPGVVQALEALSAHGHGLAVCTNKPEGLSHRLLEALQLDRYFRAVVGGDSLPVRKPDPAPLHAAIAAIAPDAAGGVGAAVMVGDSATDVATARAAAVPVIAVSFGYSSVAPRALGADAVIDHFDQLLAALAAL